MKKVCHITTVHPPFDTRIFHKEAKALVTAGYKVILIVQYDKEDIINGVKIIPLPKSKNRIYRMFSLAKRAYRLALEQEADIYHFHDPELLPWMVKLKRKTNAKVIYDVHEHYPNSILDKYWIRPKFSRIIISKIFDRLEKFLVSFLDFVIYTTPVVGKRYKEMKIWADSIENYPLLELSGNFKRNPQKNIIYLGGMTKIRGICELLESFAMVVKKHPDWRLYLIGEIKPEIFANEINKLISTLHIEKNTELINWVPYEEKEEYSSRALIGVVTYLPYANNMSCLPNKLFEYMLVGLPVVASNFSLYKEIVEGNNCGICVNPLEPKEIAKAIEYLIEHPEEARRMGENGRKAVLEKYNWENESKKLLKIYRLLQ